METGVLLAVLDCARECAEDGLPLPSLVRAITGVDSEEAGLSYMATLAGWGLLVPGATPGAAPTLLRSGTQYLARKGEVETDVLGFLPGTIDDLTAREALLEAGTAIVTGFRDATIRDEAVEFARERIVPPACRGAVDVAVAIEMFAASVALMARLASGKPAGCIAEVIVAVSVASHAETLIDSWEQFDDLDGDDADRARSAVDDIFGFFGDADVEMMLDSLAAADDAAMDGSGEAGGQAATGYPMLSWFEPFEGAPRTGHLRYAIDAPEPPAADSDPRRE